MLSDINRIYSVISQTNRPVTNMKPAEKAPKPPIDPSRLPPDRFYGSEETAAYFGYSLRHFMDLVRAGKLPQPVRLNGRKLGWRESLLREFAEALEREQLVRPPTAA